MKATSLVAGIFAVSVMSMSDNNISHALDSKVDQDILISCTWITYCGDPDIYSPVPQPTDKKTDTQDKTKDDKVA